MTVANDVTAPAMITADSLFLQGKNGDGWTPLGPWIETGIDPDAVAITVSVDGEVRAASSTARLGWNAREILVHLTAHLTLHPGDIVLTGSPGTAVAVEPGQEVLIALDGVGELVNRTVAGPPRGAPAALIPLSDPALRPPSPRPPGDPMLFDLTDRVALVTGSSRGIGRAVATGLAEAGATVVLNGLDPDRLEAARIELAERFVDTEGRTRIHARAFDVTDDAQAEAGVAWIEEHVGPLRVLVNNAGVQHRVPLLELEVADWERVLRTNLTSAFVVGRAAARRMIQRGAGKIINVASVQADLARPTIAPYTASKGGIRNLTRSMTAEWARHGIQVNAIAPGYIHTEMTQNLVDDEAFNSWILGRTPAARWGRVEDLIGPAVWLASDGSDYVNGQVVFIDGGMTVVV